MYMHKYIRIQLRMYVIEYAKVHPVCTYVRTYVCTIIYVCTYVHTYNFKFYIKYTYVHTLHNMLLLRCKLMLAS